MVPDTPHEFLVPVTPNDYQIPVTPHGDPMQGEGEAGEGQGHRAWTADEWAEWDSINWTQEQRAMWARQGWTDPRELWARRGWVDRGGEQHPVGYHAYEAPDGQRWTRTDGRTFFWVLLPMGAQEGRWHTAVATEWGSLEVEVNDSQWQ